MSVNSGSINKDEWGSWVNLFCGNIESTLQSAWAMGLRDSAIQFGFSMTPSGGCYVDDEIFNCIINRQTQLLPSKIKMTIVFGSRH